MDNGKRIEIIISALPYPGQIKNIDLSESSAIRFKWRGTEFQFSGDCCIEEVGEGALIGSDICMVIGELIKKSRMLKAL